MYELYIGTDFSDIVLQKAEGVELDTPPVVVLYNKPQQKEYIADSVVDNEDGTYSVTFSKTITINMLPGVYCIEVYKDSSYSSVLAYRENAVRANVVAASKSNN